VKGEEETAEETSDGGKATLIEDLEKRMRKRR
jgi:molybdopterin-guanine dinucleotide biosynthesis protein